MNWILLTILTLWVSIKAEIFEARESGDVDYFLSNDQSKYRAILFYDEDQDDTSTLQRIQEVQSVFDDPKIKGWKGEPWIKQLAEKAQMMRIDVNRPTLHAVVSEYEVGATPRVAVFEKDKIVLEEVIGTQTYDKLKKIINKDGYYTSTESTSTANKPASTKTPPASTPDKPATTSSSTSSGTISESGSLSFSGTPSVDQKSNLEKPSQTPPVTQPSSSSRPSEPLYQPSVPKMTDTEGECRDAVIKAEEAAKQAQDALKELKQQYEDYREAVRLERDDRDTYQKAADTKDAIEKVKNDADLFIKVR